MRKSYLIMAAAFVAAVAAVTVLFIYISHRSTNLKETSIAGQTAHEDNIKQSAEEVIFDDSVILVAEGETVPTTAAVIDDEYFIPIDTVIESINKNVAWDKAANTITVADDVSNTISNAYWSKIEEVKAKVNFDDYNEYFGYFDYCIHDIDGDGIPELIIQTDYIDYEYTIEVYTFDNDSIVFIGNISDTNDFNIYAVEKEHPNYVVTREDGSGFTGRGICAGSYYAKEKNTLIKYNIVAGPELPPYNIADGCIPCFSLISDKSILDALVAEYTKQ